MRKVKRYFSGIIAMLLLVASIPMNVFGATTFGITTQPESQTVLDGKTVSFTVAATGATSYQWQINSGSGWKDATNSTVWKGNNTNTLKFTAESKYEKIKFRCLVSGGTNRQFSNTVGFSILSITTQPTNQAVVVGNTAQFTVVAKNATAYQWQYNSGSGWKNATNDTVWKGNKTNTLKFTSDKKYDKFKFRCLTSAGSTKLYSSTVTYTAKEALAITKQPVEHQEIPRGEDVVFSVEATGAATYQWQYYNGSNWKSITDDEVWNGSKTNTLTFAADDTYEGVPFRCVVKDSAGKALASESGAYVLWRYTITFDAGEGLFSDGLRYFYDPQEPGVRELGPWNQQTGELERPVWENHVFVGWKYNGRLVEKIDIKDDIYVVAEWADECTIRYNLNGGHLSDETASFAASMGYTMDGNILKEKVKPGTYFIPQWIEPQKEGYIFKGWKYQSAYMRSATVNSAHSTIELMADWEEAVLVTYDANEGYWFFNEEEGPFETISFYQPKGTYYLNWHTPQREKYYFYGWVDVNGKNKVKVNLTQDATFKALWYPAYNVVYHGNGGQFDAEEYHGDWDYWPGDMCRYDNKNYECISEVHRNDSWDPEKWMEIDFIEDIIREERGGYYHVGSVQEPYREGYRFLGWSGIATAPRGEWGWEIPLQADMEFYAIWGKEDVEITFDANGGYIPWGEGDEYEEFDTKVLGYDPWEGMDIIMADRGEEYYFLGWSEDPDATEPTYFEHQRAYFEDSTTLYAVWEKRVAIVFDGNGGTWTWEEWDEAAGEDIERIEETRTEYRDNGQFYYVRTWQPEREGYRFDGWFDKDGNLVDDSQYITLDIDEEYVYTAKWVKQVYVTYDANGGNWYDEREDRFFDSDVWDGDEGEVHIGWGWPNKDGASFVGWSLDPDADPATDDIEHDFDVTLHDDVTYFAIWCEPFTVTYDANGGLFYDDNDNPVEYKEQDDIWYGGYELWGRIDREGYEFLGWDTNPEATKPAYHEREHIDIKGETTFYAIWHKYPTVTYYAGEGQWGDEEHPEKTKLYWSNEGEYYYVGYERPWREGYEFDGWVDENGNKVDGLLITMDQDYEFYASWSKWLNIRYYANGGQFFEWDQENQENHPIGKVMDRGAKTGEEYYLDGWMPERPGYRCIGWAYEEDPEEQVILENPIFFDVNDFETENEVDEFDVVFYAVWKKVIDVTYDFNGGTGHGLESETLYDWCQPGEYWVGWEWPYREGYEFLGWSDDPDAEDAEPNYTCVLSEMATYQDNGEENATVTFYAIWDQKVVVTFDAGEGEFDNGEQIINQYFRIGDILDWDRDFGTEEPINLWPTREGYRFVGWTFNGEDFKLIRIDEDITVEAKWIEVKTVTLDANGGTVWDEDGNSGEVIHITNNVDCTLPASMFEPVKEGYEFLGWYDANDRLVNYITFEDSYTLIAKWAGEGENPHEPYGWGVTSVTITPDKDTVEVGELFTIDHSAEGVGYAFTWFRSSDGENWTAINEGDYWIEDSLDTPGIYYYQLQIDNVESNIVTITVVE